MTEGIVFMADNNTHHDQDYDRYTSDHDLLIRIDARLSQLLDSLNKANVPAACGEHEQRHRAHDSRLRSVESRIWWIITTAIGALMTALYALVERK